MQKYINHSENLVGNNEISGYLLLKLNIYQFQLMSKCDLEVSDARHVPMYEEYLDLLKDCHLSSLGWQKNTGLAKVR